MILILMGKDGLAEGLKLGLEREGRSVVIDLDVDMGSMKAVRQSVAARKPAAVIMAEAWDDPEGCEADPDRAFLRNAETAIHVAAACLEFDAVPVLLSTSEVFGKSGGPWSESDQPTPLSVWTQSRLRGEELIRRAAKKALVLRTGPILGDGLSRERARIVAGPFEEADDEYVSPIAASEVGFAIHALLTAGASGLFHVAPKEPGVPRAELFATIAGALGLPKTNVIAKAGRAMARKVPRARSSVLVSDKLSKHLSRPLAPWRASLVVRAAEPEKKEISMGQKQDVRRVDKPWGHEIIWAHTDRYVGKVLFVKAGERLSLQYHERKDETIYVLSGKMVFEVGPKDGERHDLIMKPGDAYRITPYTTHRMIAIEDTHILEASTPELDDVVRLEDKYGRQGTKAP